MKSVLLALASVGLAVAARTDGCPAVRVRTTTVFVDPFSPSTSAAKSVASSSTVSTATAAAAITTTDSAAAAPTTMMTVVFSSSTSSTAAAAKTSATAAATGTTGSSPTVSGESTFYGGNVVGGACSFSTYTLPSSLFGTAFSGAVWNNAANCGRCVEVTGPNGNSIKAMIVDECPECAESHLDLFQNAFTELGAISAGIISTSYSFVECGITTPLVLHSKSGTSPFWFSMQVINANEGVASLEVSTDSGSTWKKTTRTDYNFFENPSGFGTDTVDVRITSTSGTTVEVSNVSVASDSKTTASSNFA